MEIKNNPLLTSLGIIIIIIIALLITNAGDNQQLADQGGEVAGITENEGLDETISSTETNEVTEPTDSLPVAQNNPSPSPEPEEVDCSSAGSFTAEFLCILNNYRVDSGAQELAFDDALNLVAGSHSIWMNQNNNLNHVGVDDSRFFERCETAGTSCFAENVAFGFSSPNQLFEMWRRSGQHNQNMLGDYSSFGLGLSGEYATTLFR